MHPLKHPDRHQAGRHFHHPPEGFDVDDGHPGRRGGPHAGPRGGHRGPGGRGRVPRGDVRTAVLLLLEEEPMHGYQLMQAIADRSAGRWTPSAGAIYPALNLLEDEGLVTVAAESGRKVATLTDAGRAQVAQNRDVWPDPFSGFRESRTGPDLRSLFEQLHGATRQVGRAGTAAQVAAAAEILTAARRQMYLLLADGPDATDD